MSTVLTTRMGKAMWIGAVFMSASAGLAIAIAGSFILRDALELYGRRSSMESLAGTTMFFVGWAIVAFLLLRRVNRRELRLEGDVLYVGRYRPVAVTLSEVVRLRVGVPLNGSVPEPPKGIILAGAGRTRRHRHFQQLRHAQTLVLDWQSMLVVLNLSALFGGDAMRGALITHLADRRTPPDYTPAELRRLHSFIPGFRALVPRPF
ncbi:MAG: hypothetical protein AAF411_03165 [Myxococcota bacterium]